MDRIGSREVLLVLDNFEHVVGASSVVVRLLGACPRLQMLVTTRSVLQVRGEHEVALAPLAAEPAVEMFAQRARQVRDDFTLDEGNRAAVAQIVDRLEGIPLAIELAAARVRILTPEALARRLDRRLDLRSQEVDRPSRQQTLRGTIGWSYALLGRQERALLRRLSVFVRGWPLEAAEAVGTVDGDLDVLDTLSALVGHSLVSPDSRSRGEPRFRMFETVREFALERLDESGERQATMRRLADYLCGAHVHGRPGAVRPGRRRLVPPDRRRHRHAAGGRRLGRRPGRRRAGRAPHGAADQVLVVPRAPGADAGGGGADGGAALGGPPPGRRGRAAPVGPRHHPGRHRPLGRGGADARAARGDDPRLGRGAAARAGSVQPRHRPADTADRSGCRRAGDARGGVAAVPGGRRRLGRRARADPARGPVPARG